MENASWQIDKPIIHEESWAETLNKRLRRSIYITPLTEDLQDIGLSYYIEQSFDIFSLEIRSISRDDIKEIVAEIRRINSLTYGEDDAGLINPNGQVEYSIERPFYIATLLVSVRKMAEVNE